MSLGVVIWFNQPVLAQVPAAPPPNIVTTGRSLVVEWVIVAVMVALALFAVCRSSRRN